MREIDEHVRVHRSLAKAGFAPEVLGVCTELNDQKSFHFTVMEKLDKSLDHYIQKNLFCDLEAGIKVFIQLVKALKEVHD